MSEADVESVFSETIGDYLSDYVTRSDLENDGYLTESELSDYLSEYATLSDLNDAGFVTSSYLSEELGNNQYRWSIEGHRDIKRTVEMYQSCD